MQVLKKQARKKIMESALEEFASRGYQKSSMRRIAAEAGFTVGNLYNYFRDKDELFYAVMEPITEPVMLYLQQLEGRDVLSSRESWLLEFHMGIASELALFIHLNRNLLDILVFKSHGSCLEMFTDDVIEKYTDLSMVFLEQARAVFPEIRKDVSRFTVHNIISFSITSIIELLMHKVPHSKMKIYLDEIMIFMYHGWQAIMDCDFEKISRGSS